MLYQGWIDDVAHGSLLAVVVTGREECSKPSLGDWSEDSCLDYSEQHILKLVDPYIFANPAVSEVITTLT